MTNSIKSQIHAATADLLKPARSKRKEPLAAKAVTTLVVGLAGANAMAAQNPGDWEFRTATLFYSETNRVQAIEPVISATRYFENDRAFSSKLVVDALTGASANGAVPSTDVQTFTRPSGNGTFTTNPNETPLDDTFRDTRVALSLGWSQSLFGKVSGAFGLNVSNEYDYLSIGLSSLFDYDFNRNNSTASFGLSFASDTISPEGGIPTALAEMEYYRGDPDTTPPGTFEDDTERDQRAADEDKTVLDILLGYTQVIDRKSLVQFNLSLSQVDGYVTDPFKVVSVLDAASGQPLRQLYESRPDSRSKQSLYTHYLRSFRQGDVLDASYRYLWDDWGMTSHTLDLRYRIGMGKHFIEPHLRYYMQEAVDFYTPFLLDGQATPVEMTADYRLGDLTTLTAGLEYGRKLKSGSEWRVALEYYLQTPDEPSSKPGQLANQEINPSVDAVMFRVNYDFDW